MWACCYDRIRGPAAAAATAETETESDDARLAALTYEGTRVFVPTFARAKVVRVYDGYTVWLAAYVGDTGAARFRARLVGYDTADIRASSEAESRVARAARDELALWILHRIVDVHCQPHLDKYGRVLATLTLDTVCVNDYMRARWGVPHSGGAKPPPETWSNVPRAVDGARPARRPPHITTTTTTHPH